MATYTYSGSFPSSPSVGETMSMNGVTYEYTSAGAWEVVVGSRVIHTGGTGITITDGAIAIDGEVFSSADHTKLDAIEASADVTDATNVAAAGALMKAGGTLTGSAQGSTDTDTTNTGNVTLDFATNQNFVLTLTGNVTLDNPSTEVVGQSGFITFIQDGTGSRTVGLGTDYETAGGAGLTLSSTASATDVVPYVVVAAGRILLGTPQLAFS